MKQTPTCTTTTSYRGFSNPLTAFLPLYESFMRGEEDEEDEEEEEGAVEVRVMEACVAARPSRNRELKVIIIIIMVIILAHSKQTALFKVLPR